MEETEIAPTEGEVKTAEEAQSDIEASEDEETKASEDEKEEAEDEE